MSKSMSLVIERHHISHADWDENQFAILCHCGTEVAGEDNGDEAYVQEEALYAGHLAEVLAAAGFGNTREAGAKALEEVAPLICYLIDSSDCWFDHHGGCQAHGYISLESGETCPQHDAKAWLETHAAAVRGEG